MIKLPKKVKIGGHWYKVLFPYHFKETVNVTAQHDNCANELRVNDRDSGGAIKADSNIMVDFIHELLHGADSMANKFIFGGAEEETRVEMLSEMIFMFLVDNEYLKIEND